MGSHNKFPQQISYLFYSYNRKNFSNFKAPTNKPIVNFLYISFPKRVKSNMEFFSNMLCKCQWFCSQTVCVISELFILLIFLGHL